MKFLKFLSETYLISKYTFRNSKEEIQKQLDKIKNYLGGSVKVL
jgi:hypothetical protein